jgi:CHAT domain-containing protein
LLIGAPEDGTGAGPFHDEGIDPADYFEVVSLLLSGDFDIVHYCGHAQFDPTAPERAGWVFKGGLLTARELEGMERRPSLVVANACVTAQLSPPPTLRRDSGLVTSLADEFFRRGTADYIGTAWEVPSIPARVFATSFYARLLDGQPLGEAVRQAREELYHRKNDFGTVWADYQHYGDPTRRFESEPQSGAPYR